MLRDIRQPLLLIDAIFNLVLGAALLLVPGGTIAFFGLPAAENHFYVTILGAVLLGIGLALWIERRGNRAHSGLGIHGAIAINMLGAGTVFAWLLLGAPEMPLRGLVTLWIVALTVLAIGLTELVDLLRQP